MGYRGQTSSRRGAGEKFQKSSHDKAKTKKQKPKSNVKFASEVPILTAEQVAEKTLSSLSKLGTQTFALSPFSQYYDDWLVSLRQVITEFESAPETKIDEALVKELTKIFVDLERELAEKRIKESELEASAKSLSENNHVIVETDVAYASQSKELAQKRNCEIERLTKNVNSIEGELSKTSQLKTSFFGLTKNAKSKKESEITQKLNAAKLELDLIVKNFAIEQEKLHDEYEKKKQATIAKVQALEKEIVNMETDNSAEVRQAASNALANAINNFLKKPPNPLT
jgi:hypothetical protein